MDAPRQPVLKPMPASIPSAMIKELRHLLASAIADAKAVRCSRTSANGFSIRRARSGRSPTTCRNSIASSRKS